MGGWLPFDRFMELALYAPGLGYYANTRSKFGVMPEEGSDFVTAPELTPLFGQPDWFLGILPSQAGNLKVLDTARWVMPERYRDDFREGLQYVISVQGYEWGLAVHQVSRSIRLEPSEIKWRSQRSQRPWLAGTVIEHMCALLDVSALAELIASGATRNGAVRPH